MADTNSPDHSTERDAEPEEAGMHITDAIRLNVLYAGFVGLRPQDDDWLDAAIMLAARASNALQAGLESAEIKSRYRPRQLLTRARVTAGKVLCDCGHTQIENGPRCEACTRDLVIPEAAEARIEHGRVLCPDCGGAELRLYGGTTGYRAAHALAMLANENWHIAFALGTGQPCAPPSPVVGTHPWMLPCVQCANEQCLRIVEVPETVRVTFGDWTTGAQHPPQDAVSAASGLHIVHACVNGIATAFLCMLPTSPLAREHTLARYATFAEPGSIQARPAQRPIGERVRTAEPIERFPHFHVPAGAGGVVTVCENQLCAVRLDEPVAGLEAWENELYFTADDAAAAGRMPATAASAMWASCEPEPLPCVGQRRERPGAEPRA